MTQTTSTTATAVRTTTVNRNGKAKSVVTVTFPDGRSFDFGGAIAARAQAVILVRWDGYKELHVEGLRGNAQAAITEAAKYARGGWKIPGTTLKMQPAEEAVAIMVEEG